MKAILPILLFALIQSAAAQNVDLGSDAQREAGQVLYETKCAHCHGMDGNADTFAREYFRPQPRDFTSSTFKFRSTENGQLPTDADIIRSIRKGMPYTGMPAWPQLSDEQVRNLMYHIKTFADDFAGPFGEVESLDLPSSPSMNEETIARGRIVYEQNQCFDCHGQAGRGDGPSAPTLTDKWDEPIRAADMTKRWTFRGGSTREDIYRTFTTGLDGSPMPAFEVEPIEDRWALVDYVYSLSRDEPNYATFVTAVPAQDGVPLSADAFADAPMAYFPIVGQIVEPGRQFFPGVNGIEVKALYSDEHIGLMLAWHDMSAETSGMNGPGFEAPDNPAGVDSSGTWSDAVAVQLPSAAPEGAELPYLLFGDDRLSADIWFGDLAGEARHYVGRGSDDLTEEGPEIEMSSSFEDGRWTVVMRRARSVEGRMPFEEGSFVPMAFSVWDGFNLERGNKRGLSSWYNLYMEPSEKESPVAPMATYGLVTLFIGLGMTFVMRRKYGGDRA